MKEGKKTQKRTRDKRIITAVTQKEKEFIDTRWELLGIKPSAASREFLVTGAVTRVALTDEIVERNSRINANNINQIAHVLNETGQMTEELKQKLDQLREAEIGIHNTISENKRKFNNSKK